MATLIFDIFTGSSGNLSAHSISPTNTPGTSWTATTGNFTLNGSGLVTPPAATSNSMNTVDAGVADVIVSCSIFYPNVSNYVGALFGRMTDANNCWVALGERDGGTPYVGVSERNAGTNTLQASTNAASLTNSTATLTLTCNGSDITADLSTGESATYNSSTFPSQTKQGVYGFTNLGYSALVTWDDFQIDDIAAATGQPMRKRWGGVRHNGYTRQGVW